MSQQYKLSMMLVLLVMAADTARGHVVLQEPNGGEVLEVDSTFTIRWRVQIAHSTQNWDLWYSVTGAGGPWLELAMDLPPGDTRVGSVHTYDWVVPDAVSDRARVRVRMDNFTGTDYYDISDGNFSIVPAAPECPQDLDGDGSVGLGDLAQLLAAYGACEGDAEFDAAADLDGDGCIGLGDLADLLSVYGADCP